MATMEEIADLRLKVAELDDTTFNDVALSSIIDQVSDSGGEYILLAAAMVWEQKAALLASLVDTSESGSSRKMGDLYKNALAMQSRYEARYKDSLPAGTADDGYVAPRVSTVVRR